MAVAVATAFPQATDAAISMLRAGGNAVDGAVAAAWALAVCEPSASGLGGQTILLLRTRHGVTTVVDGHSHAPIAASPESISRREQRRGHRACVVPSTVATLDYARRTFGRLSHERVLAPAIAIATDGYPITRLQAGQLTRVAKSLRASGAAASLFLSKSGEVPEAGTIFRQPALAATLTRLVSAGADDFYRGDIAREIARDMEQYGGVLTYSDLATCALPVERQPLVAEYRRRTVLTAPPPAGGAQLLSVLGAIERSNIHWTSVGAPCWYDTLASAIERAFHAREADAFHHATSAHRNDEPGDTTHVTVADGEGNVVALTQSIQSIFGAKAAHPTLGFVYNNYLCTCPRQPHPCALRPGGQPRSNASPAVLLRGGLESTPLLALGAAGSRRIISAIASVITAIVDGGLELQAAVDHPRVHALIDGRVWLERPAATRDVLERLHRHFKRVSIRPTHDPAMGCVQAVRFLAADLRAAADPRRDGTGIVDDTIPALTQP